MQKQNSRSATARKSSANAIPLTVSFYGGKYDCEAREEEPAEGTWEEFVDDLPEMLAVERKRKDDLPALVFARVEGRLVNANVRDHTAVVIDVDHPPKGFRKRVASKGIQCAIYETPSAHEPGKGLRYRVIAPVTAAIPPHAVPAARAAFARELGLDPKASGVDEAKSIRQIMYIGRVARTAARRHWAFDGKPWTPPPPGEAPEDNPATYGETSAPSYSRKSIPDLSVLLDAIKPAEGDWENQGGRMVMRAIGKIAAERGYHPEGIEHACLAVPSRDPATRAADARKGAEDYYKGVPNVVGWDHLKKHFGEGVMTAFENATRDPIWAAVLERRAKRVAANDTRPTEDTDAALECMSWREIMAPLPDVEWLCERLGLAVGGRPNIFAAASGAGKTLSAQALALAVASGRPLFDDDDFECARGPVLHIDLDQGRGATLHRYQGLAQGMGIRRSDSVPLECSFFGLSLTRSDSIDPKAVRQLTRAVRGKKLVIVDSLRALAPGIDENASEFGGVLIELSKISNDTGVTWLVIHHSGKGGETAVRGSSAIRGAAGCIWHLARPNVEGAPLHWSQDKVSEWALDPAKSLATIRETTPGFGVRLRLAPDETKPATGEITVNERRQLAEYLVQQPDGVSQTQAQLALASLGRNRVRKIISVMRDDGELDQQGTNKSSRLYATDVTRRIAGDD